MQTSPHIKSYASLGTLRATGGLLFCWLCLVLNAVAGPPPVITSQPRSQTVQIGGTATFEVVATSGTTLTYQWYFQSNPIFGATNSIYSIINAQLAQAGVYYAKVSNADGTVNSTDAILTVNSSPSLLGANDLATIAQNDVNNSGTLVSDLIAGKLTDPDPGALKGIAVVAANNSKGTWQYSINGGATWSPFGSPTEGAARLLAANANSRVRLVPNSNFAGTVANGLTFRAWDQTIGSNGGALAITVSSNTVLDRFTAVSYLNDDGTQLWSTRWIEADAGGIGPSSGNFKISAGQDQLQLAANHTGDNIYREANLSGATFATLSYWYDATRFVQGIALQIQVSSDAGASYTLLKTYAMPGGTGTESFDISSFISANTRIRFNVSAGQSANNDFKTDDVQITFLYPGGGPTAFSTNTASSSLTVVVAADIATTMTGPSSVSAGANYVYAVSVLNQGPSAANSLQVSQTLPAGATFVSASNGGTYNAGVVTWSLASLASGAAANLTVTVTAPASGTLSSSVSSTALTGDPNAANNDGSAAAAQVITAVIPQADIVTTMTGPGSVSAGANYAYAVSVFNQGPSTANSVQASQTLPVGATFVSASNGGAYNAGVVTWSLASLASGVAVNFTAIVTSPASGTLSSSVSSTALTSDPNAANNNGSAAAAQVVTTVIPQADIVTTMTGPGSVSAGANCTYAVSVLNLGPSTANSVQVSQTLPAGATFVSASSGGAYNAGMVTWSLAGLASGVAANLTVTVTAPASGPLSSSVESTALTSDPNAANNDGSAPAAQVVTTVVPQADIVTTMTSPSSVSAGDNYAYAVSVLNQGPSTANSVQVSQTLPAGATFVSASSGGAYSAGTVTWSLAGLASGVAANLTVTVTAPASGPLSSSVESTALTSDPNAANNDGSAAAAQVVTTVVPQADIMTTMTGPSSVSAGANYAYAVSVFNQGPSTANSVQVSQAMPAGATFVSASSGGAYNAGMVTWSLAGLASGVAANLTVNVTAPASGPLSSSVSSSALTSDPNAANNDGSAAGAQVVTTVVPQADIVTTMTGPSSVSAGANYSYAVSVLNQGPSAANSVQVSQTLPTGATFVSASSGGANIAGTVTWSLAGLASGVAANLTVTVTAPASGPLSSSVESTALTSDPNAANNDGSAAAAQVVTTVVPQADIVTTMTGPSSVSAGANYAYAVIVFNQGPSTANSVQVSQTLPAGATFVSASSGGAYSAGMVTWSLAGLASGVAANLTVTVTAPASGPLSSSVESTALTSDPNAANNDSSALAAQVVTTVIPQADIVTTMTGPSSVSAGANYAYAVSVLNQGPSTANSVQVSQALPAGAIFVSASSGGAYSAGMVTWSLAGLASGVAANLSVTVTAPASGTLSSSVSSTALTSDPNDANNDGSAAAAQVVTTVTSVTLLADIATTVTGPAIAITNANFSYTVTVANLGPSVATNLSVTNKLPAGVVFVAASAGGTHNAGVVTWSVASLTSGMATNLAVTAVAPATGSLTNTVASSAANGDPDMSNNNGSAAAARVVTKVYPFLVLTGQPLPSGSFQIEFYTYPDTEFSILASTNLVDWATLITTNSGNGHVVFIDQDADVYPKRFYRSLQDR